MRQGLWTNLMEPRQRQGERRGFEGSTLGSWQILHTFEDCHTATVLWGSWEVMGNIDSWVP